MQTMTVDEFAGYSASVQKLAVLPPMLKKRYIALAVKGQEMTLVVEARMGTPEGPDSKRAVGLFIFPKSKLNYPRVRRDAFTADFKQPPDGFKECFGTINMQEQEDAPSTWEQRGFFDVDGVRALEAVVKWIEQCYAYVYERTIKKRECQGCALLEKCIPATSVKK